MNAESPPPLRPQLGDPCCVPVIIGRFVDATLTDLGLRHLGPLCAGWVNGIDIRAWRQGKIVAKQNWFEK